MGSVDRVVRLVVAAVLIGLFATSVTSGVWGMVSVGLAVVFILTSLVSTCPLYLPFGIRTNRSRKRVD